MGEIYMTYKTILHILVATALLFFIIGCTEAEETQEVVETPIEEEPEEERVMCPADVQECPDGSYVSRDPDNNCEFFACPELPEPEVTELSIELQERADAVRSYAYLDSTTNKVMFVRGNKTVMVTSNPNEFSFEGYHANTIYIDHTEQTAYAACTREGVAQEGFRCDTRSTDRYWELDYADISYRNPYEYIYELTDGEVTGTQTCDNRQCDVVSFTQDDQQYRMLVRHTVVMPFEVRRVNPDGTTELLVRYSAAAFNHLSESDVTLPSGLRLIESEA